MGEDLKYLLFTTKYCTACAPVKKFLEQKQVSGNVVDASEESDLAIKYEVRSVPTVVFFDDSGNEIGRANNVPEARSILSD